MSQECKIGILGGMGPEATFDCFGKLIKNTPANCDQEHLGIVIVNNPKIPDRTEAILAGGTSPLPALHQGVEALKCAGADFVIIPCVTAHYFLEELIDKGDLPVLSILDAVAVHIHRNYSNLKRVGLLGSSGTVQSKIFQKRLNADGVETLVCHDEWQQQVMEGIYDIKNENTPRSPAEITASLVDAAIHLIDRGAQGIIAGCTEIPLALSQKDLSVPYFDSLLILARAAIRRAGQTPILT